MVTQPSEDPAAELFARLSTGTRNEGVGSTGTAAGSRRRWRRRDADPEYSGPGPDSRDPTAAGRALAELLDAQGWRQQIDVVAALARWEEIAGPDVAAHVVAESFTDGVLTLRADSTAWATQLRLLMPTLRTRIDATVGQGVVADIVVRGPEPPRRRGAWRVPGRGPRDTYG